MSEGLGVEQTLSKAAEREKEYDWLRAAEFYKKALDSVAETDFSNMGRIQERIGYALYRTAIQAESREEFRERMLRAIASYEKAKEFYGRVGETKKKPWMLRCNAMIAYVGYWLASEVSEKKRLLDECWRLAEEALKAFDEAGEALEYGKTFNQLSASASGLYDFEWDFQAREKIVRNAMEHGERAITALSAIGDFHELARAYVRTAYYLEVLGGYFLDSDRQKKYTQKAADYWLKADGLSEEAAMIELPPVGGRVSFGWGPDKALMNFNKALEYGRKTRDHFIVGCALELLASCTAWKAFVIEDPDERKELYKRALQYAEDAKHNYLLVSFVSPWVEAPHAEHYMNLARWVETNPSKRRELLEKAQEAAPDLLKRAENSGYPDAVNYANDTLGFILWLLALTETNFDEKKKLLEKALKHWNDSLRLTEQLQPTHYWNRGVMLARIPRIKSELALADLTMNREAKINMLQEAMFEYENAFKLVNKSLESLEMEAQIPRYTVVVRIGAHEYGHLLNCLYGLTNDRKYLRKAAELFEDLAKSLQKLNLASLTAECHWKTAQFYDNLGEHLKAAENFNMASDNYRSAAEKIPQLKGFYQDQAVYMQAWNEIEKARHHHVRQEYGLAKEHYEKAASVHKSLKQWSYLASNYSAWAQVENAEDLSRSEKSEEALQAFKEAAKLFTETKKFLETKLGEIENPDEQTMVNNLTEASDTRRECCLGRMALEEAKILDRKGDHYSSSEKYRSAAETFEKIAQQLESKQDREEFRLMATLSRAWQKMAQAEAETSATLYIEASQLFKEAKDLSPGEREKTLALGHSRFCEALEAGTKFIDMRDTAQHDIAIQHLESAASYYVRVRCQSASEYAKATELLLDAYMYIGDAKKEKDPEKKAKLYTMTEKILQQSAASFVKAEQPEKREQVLKLLEKVREERELAVYLSEVLHAPSIASTTTAFATPAPAYENSVGLERFEHADIQANVTTRQKSLNIGESLDLEITLVNAGKGPGLLIKLAEVIPEGFELTQKPEIYRVEDSFLNMRGRRLDPLKTEEVRLILKPKVKGVFPLKPRIDYLDENGKYKSHEPEPVTITVRELGIKGWLKGER
jgi:hypothetical protein